MITTDPMVVKLVRRGGGDASLPGWWKKCACDGMTLELLVVCFIAENQRLVSAEGSGG